MSITVPEGYVYLDWAATAPLCAEAREAMEPFLASGLSNIALGMNANSLHSPGRAAFEALELARKQLASDIGASRPQEVIFTSGATEADNTVLLDMASAIADARHVELGGDRPRVVMTELEHDAVLKCAKPLQHAGFDVSIVKPDRKGFINPDALERVLDDRTVLVSVQMANSEIGSIQSIAQLAKLTHDHGAYFHTDAVQALGKTEVNVYSLGVDAASFSAHKVCGPKGIGALFVKARTPFSAMVHGGGQENGRRSGTQNVCGAVGFAAACHAAVSSLPEESLRERSMRDALYDALGAVDGVLATIDVAPGDMSYLPNIVNVLVSGYESETLILKLDLAGYGVSGGSACSSHSLDPSHVLKAIGINDDEAYGALRISFGRYTSESDLQGFVEALRACIL